MLQNNTNDSNQKIIQVMNTPEQMSNIFVKNYGKLRSKGHFYYEKINLELNIHFVTSGKGILKFDDHTYHPGAGDIFILFPKHYTLYYDNPEIPWHYEWFTISIPENHPALSRISITPDTPVKKLPPDSSIWRIIRRIGKLFEDETYSAFFPVKAAWEILDALAIAEKNTNIPLAERIKHRIDLAELPLEVNELAEHFKVDRSTIFRVFKNTYGITVKSYIDKIRYENVCDLLKNTMYPISTIARFCGFDNAHYFSRAFRKRFTLSPSEYRNRDGIA